MTHEEARMDENTVREGLLSQPQFVEEATLESAQPVVPLAEVRKHQSRKRGWLFLTALVLAGLVGAGGAALIYSRQEAAPVAQAEQPVVEKSEQPEQLQVPEGTTSPDAEITETETTKTDAPKTDSEETASVVKERPTESATRDSAVPRATTSDSRSQSPVRREGGDDTYRDWQETRRRRVQERREQLSEERREQRREARREGRRQRRGQARSGDGSADELFRIREIFEGRRP